MLDVKAIREDPDRFRAGLGRRNLADAVDRLLAADERRRTLTARVDELRAEQNRASKAIGRAEGDEKQRLIDEVARVSAEVKQLEPQLAEADEDLTSLLGATPNLPHETAPDGFTEEDAVELRRHLEPTEFDFEPKDHVELGASLGVLDIDRAVRASGSRFVYVLGDLVFVQFALMRHAMDILVGKGFVPVIPPVLVREEVMYGSGSSRPMRSTSTERTSTSCISSALRRHRSPRCTWARSWTRASCRCGTRATRRASGGSRHLRQGHGRPVPRASIRQGRDVLFLPSRGRAGRARVPRPSIEEEIVGNLEVPYRVTDTAAGDLGAAASKKYDIEAWLPGQGRYREIVLLELH